MLENPISRRLYGSSLKLIVTHNIARSRPMDTVCGDVDLAMELLGHHDNLAFRITRIALAIPGLRVRAKHLLSQPMTGIVAHDLRWLVEDAKSVDRMLLDWKLALPDSWRYEKVRDFACVEEEILESHYYPGPAHSYYGILIIAPKLPILFSQLMM